MDGGTAVPSAAPGVRASSSRSLLPWLLFLPALLLFALLLRAGYGIGWASLGVLLGAICLLLGQRGRWSLSARVGGSLSLALLGEGLTLAVGPVLDVETFLLMAAAADKPAGWGKSGIVASTVREGRSPEVPAGSSNPPVAVPATPPQSAPDLRYFTGIGTLLSVAVVPDSAGNGVAFTTTADGALRRFTYPDFRLQQTYRLRHPGYRTVADGRRGQLWIAASDPSALRVSGVAERAGGRGDLHLYDLPPAPTTATDANVPLQPRRILPVQGDVIELLATADRRWLFYLARTPNGIQLCRIDAEKETVDLHLSLPAEMCALCLTPDGATLYAAGGGSLLTVDPATLEPQRRIELPADFVSVAASNAGRVFLGERGQWTSITELDLGDSEATFQKWPAHVHGRVYLKLATDQHRLYIGTSSLISNHLDSMYVWKHPWQTPSQNAVVQSDANGSVRGEFFLTPDGRFLVNRWGKVYRLATGPQ